MTAQAGGGRVTAQAEEVIAQQRTVTTAHPLQRVGAFALAELAEVDHPDELGPEQFDAVTRLMTRHLLGTVNVANSKDPGGFWLGAGYLFWPNSPGLTTTNRKKMLPPERRERITQWRTLPDRSRWPGVPCALCARPACGYYGKVDVPLGASTAYRNTTPPDHDGLALCFACLSSFHALPYACQIGGGRAAVLHSWDEDFLREFVGLQVVRTLQEAAVGTGSGERPPYWREVTALRQLRRYPHRLCAGVQLIVFSNSNREQVFEEHSLDQPLAEWLRSTLRDPGRRDGYRYLVRAYHTTNYPGTSLLARGVFHSPDQVPSRVTAFLRRVTAESATEVPGEAPHLVPLIFSYAIEVLQVNEKDIGRIRELADRIAEVLVPHRERGVLKGYENAHRDSRRLQEWLRKRAVSWALRPSEDRTVPFVTADQWRLLFDPDGRAKMHQDLLFIAVLEQLHHRGWRADDVKTRADLDDDLINEPLDDPTDDLTAQENQ